MQERQISALNFKRNKGNMTSTKMLQLRKYDILDELRPFFQMERNEAVSTDSLLSKLAWKYTS